MVAEVDGELWRFNLACVRLVDVSQDYLCHQPPLPAELYPVVAEMWVPRVCLPDRLAGQNLVEGYLYDWHLTPDQPCGLWYVGVVHQELLSSLTLLN